MQFLGATTGKGTLIRKSVMCEQARPKPRGEAFQVHQSERFLTVPDDVVLPGEERSQRRAEFDAAMAGKERRQKVLGLATFSFLPAVLNFL